MVREIITTDQELIWSEKSGLAISRTNEAIRIRNIALKEINGIDNSFAQKEKLDLELIQKKFKLNEWIPYFSFSMHRVLNDRSRKNLLLAQMTKKGKYATFYGEEINQSDEDFIEQFEAGEKICKNKELLPVLDPAEMDAENLGRKAKYFLDRGTNKIVIQYRDILKYILGWEALRVATGNKIKWIVVDVKPKKTNDSYKYSNLIAPFFFNDNILVSHGRGRGFGDSVSEAIWLNNHFSYKSNKVLEKGIPKYKLTAYGGVYNINKAINLVSEKLQNPDLTTLTNIDGVTHFAKQLALLHVK